MNEELKKAIEKESKYCKNSEDLKDSVFQEICNFGYYNTRFIIDSVKILDLINKNTINYLKIAEELNLEDYYVELLMELLADRDMLEYGTSPRNCWITKKGKELLEFMNKE